MGILPPSAEKHKLDGIGGASAAAIMAALLANPGTSFLAAGFLGKILYPVLTYVFSALASMGLVLLNLGAENVLGAIEKSNFDGSFESAERLINQIRSTGRELTPEEVKKIDDNVIEQFRKFAKMTRGRA